jgi:UDP:flavonoid glycosyltransferase YjiC (YdhE family)
MPGKQLQSFACDVVFAGNMAGGVETCLRIAGQARSAQQAGYKVGLLHVPHGGEETTPISPEVRLCLRGSPIVALDPVGVVSARLLVIYPPCEAEALARIRTAVTARRVVLVPDPSGDISVLAAEVSSRFPKMTVAPTTPKMRERLLAAPHLRLEPRDWRPAGRKGGSQPKPPARDLVVGAVIPPHWPQAVDVIREITGKHPDLQVCVWRDRGPRRQLPSVPGHWKSLDGVEISFEWFLRRIDVLLVPDDPAAAAVPQAAIAAAQNAGKLVAAVSPVQDDLPPGVIVAAPNELMEAVRRALIPGSTQRKGKPSPRARGRVDPFLKRLPVLTGTSPTRRPVAKPAGGSRRPRVLFMPKGGVGVGHVARLLAIARRGARDFDPVFVSLADSAGFIEDMGFRAELIPSCNSVGAESAEWNPWFQYELEHLIDAYDASAVVFDGSDPPAVLSRAVASRSWCKGVWVRRGMWEPGYNPSLQRSGNYDVIIEPGDIAGARDRGATVARRHEALQVDPVTLLDASELLSREAAAKHLGLDPGRPAVLVQLGSGENRDVLSLIDRIISGCRRHGGLQVAVAEWTNATETLNLWSDITVLKGAPLSLYYRAFDFTISAAGYNSFHEIINFGLPAVLVPNQAPGMDDQAGRSAFAQDAGAAIELKEHEFSELPGIIELFMKPQFRDVMRENCRALTRDNGAKAASKIIAELVN